MRDTETLYMAGQQVGWSAMPLDFLTGTHCDTLVRVNDEVLVAVRVVVELICRLLKIVELSTVQSCFVPIISRLPMTGV